jgi:arylsulfatase A-like enzyme/Tfp pilus assembly protein PilF
VIVIATAYWWFSAFHPLGRRFGNPQARKRESAIPGVLPSKDNNVFLITLDTLRADHLGCYGYSKIETPNLDRVAREGVKFQNALCQVPLTLPSHTSILTGTYPLYHGIRDNAGFFLDESFITLAKVLQSGGFKTGAAVGAFILDSKWGLNQGFDFYDDQMDPNSEGKMDFNSARRRGDRVLQAALKWLEPHKTERLFFWLHLYDAHSPYDPPEPYRSRYAERLYDGGIAYVDQLVGQFVSWLTDNHLLEKSLIVILGDHGEGLGEHQEYTHGMFVYESTLRIPLIVRFPQQEFRSREIQLLVRSIDIMPTILRWLNLPIPAFVQGASFLPLITEEDPHPDRVSYGESYYAKQHFGWSEVQCLRTERYKYIKAPEPELYDLQRDPNERRNLFYEEHDSAQALDEQLRELIHKYEKQGAPRAGQNRWNEQDLKKLRSLGYLGSPTRANVQGRQNLPDPKEKMHLYNMLLQAESLAQDGDLSQARALLQRIISMDPQVIDAYAVLGRLAFDEKDYRVAISWSKKILDIRSDYVLATLNIALSYRQLNERDNAVAGFQEVLKLDPRNQKALFNMAEISLETGDLDRAAGFCEEALRWHENQPDIYVVLASVHYGRQEYAKAEEALKKAIAFSLPDQPIRNLHFNLALVCERRNDEPGAIEEYKKEISHFPDNFKALTNLGILYEDVGSIDKEIETFRKVVEINSGDYYGYFLLAQALFIHRGENKEAKKLVEQSLRLNFNFAEDHYLLSAIYKKEGNLQKAKEEYERAQKLEKSPD